MPAFKEKTEQYATTNGDFNSEGIVSCIPSVPVTMQRKPFLESEHPQLVNPGTPRANIAADTSHPNGTTENGWAEKYKHQTVLQQHCAFFDRDSDGIIWPRDTYTGFSRLGYHPLISLLAVFIIHINFSYATQPSWIPDPWFRIYLVNAHKMKHGSDSETFDHEGRFIPLKFEEMFTKYAGLAKKEERERKGEESNGEGKAGVDEEDVGLTLGDMWNLLAGQRNASDPIGWGGGIFEWSIMYILLWPEDGKMRKEDIRKCYDGSIYFEIAEKRERIEKERRAAAGKVR